MTKIRRDVAPFDSEQAVTALVTAGLCLLFFSIVAAIAARDSLFPSPTTPVLAVVGAVCLVGAVIVHVNRVSSN